MAHLHTGRALGSDPSFHVEFYADKGTRTTSGTYVTLSATVYFAYAGSSFYPGYDLTAYFYVGGAWRSVPITWVSSSTITGGAWTVVGRGSASVYISCSTSATSISIPYVKTGSNTMQTSGIMGQTTPSVASSISITPVYSVSYNLNGGSGSFATQYYVYGGSNINLHSTIPTKSGYNFLGWSLSSTATSPSYYAGQGWSSGNPDNYILYAVWEVANGKSSFRLSNLGDIKLDSSTAIFITRVSSSNTHTIVLTLPTGSYTLATGVGESHTFTLPASTWAKLFTDSKSIDGTITVTTYSGSTSLGGASQGVTITLPESIGKPDKPTVILSDEHAASATINLKKPTFKYGATFKEWQVETNIGKAKVIGNRIYIGIDPAVNKVGIVTVRAMDSRGFMSDPVSVQWRRRKRGNSIFINGKWISGISYIYEEDKWVEYKHPYIYLEEKDLVSKDEYEILDANGLELKGDDSWENIH